MFITLEGPDGSGKTSQVAPLALFLEQQGFPVLTTREPGGTEIGDQTRQILMSMNNKAMNPRTEILLFCSARAQIVEEVIRPHISQGGLVISDRYADSTLAYQGYGHGFDLVFLRKLLDFTTGGLWPDLTILFDLDPAIGLKRRKKGQTEWNRLDDYDLDFHQRVRHGYIEMASQEPERWLVINADEKPETLHENLIRNLMPRLTTPTNPPRQPVVNKPASREAK
jgi:dTMP kinase